MIANTVATNAIRNNGATFACQCGETVSITFDAWDFGTVIAVIAADIVYPYGRVDVNFIGNGKVIGYINTDDDDEVGDRLAGAVDRFVLAAKRAAHTA